MITFSFPGAHTLAAKQNLQICRSPCTPSLIVGVLAIEENGGSERLDSERDEGRGSGRGKERRRR